MIRAKNDKTVTKFVTVKSVMPRILWPLFPGNGVQTKLSFRFVESTLLH